MIPGEQQIEQTVVFPAITPEQLYEQDERRHRWMVYDHNAVQNLTEASKELAYGK